MAEDKDKAKLREAVEKIPSLLEEIQAWGKKTFGKEKFAEIKIGEKSYSYSGESFGIGTELKDCPDGDYQTETHSFSIKDGKVTDYKEKEKAPVADFSAQLAAQEKSFTERFASQKTDFEKEIKAIKEAFDKKVDEVVNGKLKEMFDLIEKIAGSATEQSSFKKKDGEPAPATGETAFDKARKEAALMSKKVFN